SPSNAGRRALDARQVPQVFARIHEQPERVRIHLCLRTMRVRAGAAADLDHTGDLQVRQAPLVKGARARSRKTSSHIVNLLVPFGFYGAGNIGDEATLNGFAGLLDQSGRGGWRASIASRNPSHVRQAEPAFSYFRSSGFDPRRWWAKQRADAVVFAGGTPI